MKNLLLIISWVPLYVCASELPLPPLFPELADDFRDLQLSPYQLPSTLPEILHALHLFANQPSSVDRSVNSELKQLASAPRMIESLAVQLPRTIVKVKRKFTTQCDKAAQSEHESDISEWHESESDKDDSEQEYPSVKPRTVKKRKKRAKGWLTKEKTSGAYPCEYKPCPKVYTSWYVCQEHMRFHRGTLLKCLKPRCPAQFEFTSVWVAHLFKAHGINRYKNSHKKADWQR